MITILAGFIGAIIGSALTIVVMTMVAAADDDKERRKR